MFKLLNFGPFKGKVAVESQRQKFTRALEELNEVVEALADKPQITFDPQSGRIDFALPDQFPDEALALPAPAKSDDAEPKALATAV